MGSNLGIRTEVFSPPENHSWLGSAHGTNECDTVTLDADAFLGLWPDGVVPSGVVLYKHSSGLYRPFAAVSADEVQTITEGGSGLTSYVLHLTGYPDSASIAAAATSAQVQAAIEAMVGAGNVSVSGSASGPYTVTFQNALADQDVAQMTATPTGGTGTVTIATTTAGGTDTDTAAGHLYTTTWLGGTTSAVTDKVPVPMLWHGEVVVANLPVNHGLTTGAQTDLKHIHYV